jgi:hypothetical protein
MRAKELAKDIWVLCLMVALGIVNFMVFGQVHAPGWKDSSQYSALAANLLQGHGYSLDGVTVSAFREPGVSFYLLPFYSTLGIETPVALFTSYFTEGILIGILGFVFYRIVKNYSTALIAVICGASIALHPILGDHTNEIGTETLFTFMVGVTFLLCLRVLRKPEAMWYWYALLVWCVDSRRWFVFSSHFFCLLQPFCFSRTFGIHPASSHLSFSARSQP